MLKEYTEIINEHPGIIKKVEDFASASLNNDPLLYPGERPETSYLTDGISVSAVYAENIDGQLIFTVHTAEGRVSLDTILSGEDVDLMADRLPVLGYGANACPASLKQKFTVEGRPDLQIVPTLYADMKGYDVVWSNRPGQKGNFIAQLYSGPETENTSVTVGINFLTREQLLILHGTEMNYEVGHLSNVEIEGVSVPAICYVGRETILLDNDKKPVAIESIPAKNRTLTASSTEDLLDEVLQMPEVSEALAVYSNEEFSNSDCINARQYVEAALSRKLAEKKRMQAIVGDVLAKLGHKHKIDMQSQANIRIHSWANPSTIPNFAELMNGTKEHTHYLLPHQVLPTDKWPDQKKRSQVLSKVAKHFHNGRIRS